MTRHQGSYIAQLRAKPGTLLLGGVRTVQSSRFETEEQAKDYVWAMMQPNVAVTVIAQSPRPPQIRASETLEMMPE
jgi:hypothetical protein